MLKVNIGCGPIGKEDWVNIDYGILAVLHKYKLIPVLKKVFSVAALINRDLYQSFSPYFDIKWPNNLLIHNCLKRLPFKDNEVDYVFTSHFFEHIKHYETVNFLKEMHRVLRKGGIIRISIPDLSIITKKYLNKDSDFFLKHSDIGWNKEYSLEKKILLGDGFCCFFYPYYTKKKQEKFIEHMLNYFVRNHQWIYDYESISDLLKRAGFSKIKKCNFRQGKVPDIKILDMHPEESLYVEAEK